MWWSWPTVSCGWPRRRSQTACRILYTDSDLGVQIIIKTWISNWHVQMSLNNWNIVTRYSAMNEISSNFSKFHTTNVVFNRLLKFCFRFFRSQEMANALDKCYMHQIRIKLGNNKLNENVWSSIITNCQCDFSKALNYLVSNSRSRALKFKLER